MSTQVATKDKASSNGDGAASFQADTFEKLIKSQEPRSLNMKLGPKLAQRMLGHAGPNRPISKERVEMWADDMRKGRWRFNGSSVSFTHDGHLIDGQHRLHAIIEADAVIDTVVVFGLDPQVMTTIDTGRKRTLANALTINGVPGGAGLSAVLALLWAYRLGRIAGGERIGIPTHAQLLALLADEPDVKGSLWAGELLRTIFVRSVGAFCHYVCSRVDAEAADDFFRRLADGTALQKGDPVYHLRELMLKERNSRAKRPRHEIIGLTFKAWNHYRAGRTVKQIHYRAVGEAAETFPVPA